MFKHIIILNLICISICQNIFTEYVIEGEDTLDVFSYQIPSLYSDDFKHPLLVAFHQWGGNQNTPYYTNFDEEAELRNWIFLSPYGGANNNYNHQGAQYYTEQAILWLSENYSIDQNRIYMVGGSMGGASGAIYANNHLNPNRPMVAATASASGILDCERRAIEMNGNNSMIEWFGGNWDEVPFEYHRNSAVYFADSTQSMHYNLQYTPLYLDFGVTEPHRTHAEDLYNLLENYNQDMWIDTEPTGSHGYSVIDEEHACDWLSQYELINNPDIINVNLDEPSRAYWIEAHNQFLNDDFIRINIVKSDLGDDVQLPGIDLTGIYSYQFNTYTNSDSLILHILDEQYVIDNIISAGIEIDSNIKIGFSGNIFTSENIPYVDINQGPFSNNCGLVNYTIDNNVLWIEVDWINSDCQESLPYLISFNFFPDLNGDGIWSVLDIMIIVSSIIGDNNLSNFQLANADFNDDNFVDLLDIILILNQILEN